MLEFFTTQQPHANYSTSAMETGNRSKKAGKSKKQLVRENFKFNAVQKLLYMIFGILLFTGCVKEKEKEKIDGDLVVGTKWISTTGSFLDMFMYIHFIDEYNVEFCFVDYYYNKFTELESHPYSRTANDEVSLQIYKYTESYLIRLWDAEFSQDKMEMRVGIEESLPGHPIYASTKEFEKAKKDVK